LAWGRILKTRENDVKIIYLRLIKTYV
jgi:hypothetical protein